MTTQLDGAIRPLTTEALTAAIDEYAMIEDAIRVSAKRLGELEVSIRQSLVAENATKSSAWSLKAWPRSRPSRFPHPRYTVSLTPGRKVYDLDKVRAALGEKLPPDEIDKGAPTEPVECKSCEGRGVVSPKVSGTWANKIRRYGDEYAAALDQCIVTQGEPELEIKAK